MNTLTYSKSSISHLRGATEINLVETTFPIEVHDCFQVASVLREFIIAYRVGFDVHKMSWNNQYIINFDNGHYINFTVEGSK